MTSPGKNWLTRYKSMLHLYRNDYISITSPGKNELTHIRSMLLHSYSANQLICTNNQLTDFYMSVILAWQGLSKV